MTAAILSFPKRAPKPRDWNNQEIAEFHRAVDALARVGFQVETDRGLTDEGEPWFVFARPEGGEVIAHFARLDGAFIADAGLLESPIRANDLRDALNRILQQYEVLVPQGPRNGGGSKLSLHPAAMLTAVVATALMQLRSDEARAGTPGSEVRGGSSPGKTGGDGGGSTSPVHTGALMTAAIAAVGLAATPVEGTPAASAPSVPTLPGVEAMAAILEAIAGPETAEAAGRDTPVAEADTNAGALSAPDPDASGRGDAVADPIVLRAPSPDPAPTVTTIHAPRPEISVSSGTGTPAGGTASGEDQPVARRAVADGDGGESFTAAESLEIDPVDFQGVTLDAEGARTLLRALLPAEDGGSAGQTPSDGGQPGNGADNGLWRGLDPGDDQDGEQETGSGRQGDDADGEDGADTGESDTAPPDEEPTDDDPPADDGEPDSASDFAELAEHRAAALTDSANYVFDNRDEAQKLYLDLDTFAGQTAKAFRDANDGELPTVVAFESESLSVDAFAFMPGVIFMEADALTPQLDVAEMADLDIDLADGGSVSLVGIGSVEALTA